MDTLRGLAAAAVLAVLGVVCLAVAAAAVLALPLVLYWEQRVLVLSLYALLFAAGGALAVLVARVRARDNLRQVALSIASQLVYWVLNGVRALGER